MLNIFSYFFIHIFNFFKKGGGFILNFKRLSDIESVYNIVDIKNEYILSKENDKLLKIYIYMR